MSDECSTPGCEVCQSYRPEANLRERTLTTVFFGERGIVLCEMHRRIAENSGIRTWDELREFYGESTGRRSYVPRRASLTKGAPPPAPERRRQGRRATDMG